MLFMSLSVFAQEEKRTTNIGNYFVIGINTVFTPFKIGFESELIRPDKIGGFMIFRSSLNTPNTDMLMDNISYYEAKYTFNDAERDKLTEFTEYGAGVNYSYKDELRIGFGLIYTAINIYKKFYDKYQILGSSGEYYVKPQDSYIVTGRAYVSRRLSDGFNVSIGYSISTEASLDIGITWVIGNYHEYPEPK